MELFAAINFSLLAVHIASQEGNKGFHSIMIDWVIHYFSRLELLFTEKIISATYSEKYTQKLENKKSYLNNCRKYIEKTQGFTMSCLLSGLNSTCLLILIGYYGVDNQNNFIHDLYYGISWSTFLISTLLLFNDLRPLATNSNWLKRKKVKIKSVLIPFALVIVIGLLCLINLV